MIPSTQPYLVRALHEWCTENNFTPYIVVYVTGQCRVPREFVKDNEIVLNVSYGAAHKLQIDNEFIQFNARFSGVPQQLIIPISHVVAIYAKENGQGMSFPRPTGETPTPEPSSPAKNNIKPTLTRVK